MFFPKLARSSLRQTLTANLLAKSVLQWGCSNSGNKSCYTWVRRAAMSNTRHPSIARELNGFKFEVRGISIHPQVQSPLAERVEENLEWEAENENLPGLGPTKPGEKPRVVVLGTGWAGCCFLKGIDTKLYDIVCISPRNHMVFTPLLASTCVGTLEFRSVAEPVSRIQSALSLEPNSYFYLANCIGLNADKHEVYCQTVPNDGLPKDSYHFKVAYDKLVIAAGSEPVTFNIKGVKEHAFFLREVSHAQEIRRRLLLNLMLSENPVNTPHTRVTDSQHLRLLLHYLKSPQVTKLLRY